MLGINWSYLQNVILAKLLYLKKSGPKRATGGVWFFPNKNGTVPRMTTYECALESMRHFWSNDASHVQNGPIPEIFRLLKKFMHIWGILLRNFYLNSEQHQRCFELIFKTRQFFGVESSQVAGCKCVRKNNVEASWDCKKNLVVVQHPDWIWVEHMDNWCELRYII